MLRYDRAELIGMTAIDVLRDADSDDALAAFEKQARGEMSLAKAIPLLRKDGGIIYADENGTLRALMTDTGIVYLDENEAVRAVMNLGGIHYRDENGTTVWSTACAPNC